jgi:HEAT repeat protein
MKKVYYFITIHAFILLLWIVMMLFFQNPMIPAFFYGVAFAIDISFLLQRFNVADETCSVFESRTIYPNLPVCYSIGVVTSGFIVSRFGNFFTGINALIVSSLILVALIMMVGVIRIRYNKLYLQKEKHKKHTLPPPPYKNIIKMIFKNKIVRIICALVIISFFAQYYISYLLNTELKKALSPPEITAFLGQVSYTRHGLVILANIFLMRFLLKNVGSIYLGLFKPLLTLLIMIPYLAFPHYLMMAAVMITYEGGETAFFVLSRRFSYNVFPRNVIGRLSLIMEGSVAMIGILLSGIAIYFFKPSFNIYLLILPAIVGLLIWLYLHSHLRRIHLKTLLQNVKSKDKELQHQSIDALIEKPNKKEASAEFVKMIRNKTIQDPATIERLYFALGKLADLNTLPFFLSTLNNAESSDQIKQIIYQNLLHFGPILRRAHVTRHDLIEVSKQLLLHSKNPYLKEMIVQALSQINIREIVPLLIENLHHSESMIRLNSIRSLGYFKDIGIVHTLEHILKTGSPEEKEKCVIALWQFTEQRPFLFPVIAQLMYASEKEKIVSGIDLVGTLKLYWEQSYLLDHLKNTDHDIQKHAALSLTILEREEGVPLYLQLLKTNDPLKHDALLILQSVSESFRSNLFNEIAKLPEESIRCILNLLHQTGSSYYEEIDQLESLLHSQHTGTMPYQNIVTSPVT